MEQNIYGMSTSGLLTALTDHSDLVKLNCRIEDDAPIIIVDDILIVTPPECEKLINTSDFARLMVLDKEFATDFNKTFEISKKKAVSVAYCFVAPSGATPLCEVGFSMRYMNGNVGSEMFMSHACGFIVDEVPEQIQSILTYIKSRYAGEVTFALDESGNVCSLILGHSPHLLSVYAEFFAGDIDGMLAYMVEEDAECPKFKAGTSLMSAVTKYPFPYLNADKAYVRAEVEAEKHLWRMPMGLVFVSAWSDAEEDSNGTSFSQCRKRIFRTLKRARKYDDFLHYRTDMGYSLSFSLVAEQYKATQR